MNGHTHLQQQEIYTLHSAQLATTLSTQTEYHNVSSEHQEYLIGSGDIFATYQSLNPRPATLRKPCSLFEYQKENIVHSGISSYDGQTCDPHGKMANIEPPTPCSLQIRKDPGRRRSGR